MKQNIKSSDMPKKAIKNGDNSGKDPKTGRFLPGNPGGPGHPLGTKNFSTVFDKVVNDFAKAAKITPEEAEKQLVDIGFVKAKKGNFKFWDSIMARVYGKPRESIDLELSGAVDLKDIQAATKALAQKIKDGK